MLEENKLNSEYSFVSHKHNGILTLKMNQVLAGFEAEVVRPVQDWEVEIGRESVQRLASTNYETLMD
jgi:hypothetical protein